MVKRLIANLPDNKFLTVLFVGGQEARHDKGDIMYVITGEKYPHVGISFSINEIEEIVNKAGHSYIIDDFDAGMGIWWR